MLDPLIVFGHPLMQGFWRLISFGVFLVQLIKSCFRNWTRGFSVMVQVTSFQIYFTCIQALPAVFFLALFIVAVVLSQADDFFGTGDTSKFVATLFEVVIVRELAPLLTCLIVVGRSGTAVASELTSMTANEEIDALKIMGVDPMHYLVIPRLIGVTLSVICLSITFSLISLFATMGIGYYLEAISPSAFLAGVVQCVTGLDIFLNLFKSTVFGAAIALICAFWGFSARGSNTEIPQMTTHAVISSVFWCFVISGLITILVY